MMGKLLKYDLRSLIKRFVPIWAGIVIISLVNGFTMLYSDIFSDYSFTADVLPKLLLFGMSVAAFVLAVLYIYREFYHGLLGDRGYLMFTLPVKEEELIGSKAAAALIMESVSAAVVIFSFSAMIMIPEPDVIYDIVSYIWNYLFVDIESGLAAFILIIETVAVFLTGCMTFNFQIYTASAVSHLFGKHRRIACVAAFILLFVVSVSLYVNIADPLQDRIFRLCRDVYTGWRYNVYPDMFIIGMIIAGELLYSAVMFFIVRYILKNRLNLE